MPDRLEYVYVVHGFDIFNFEEIKSFTAFTTPEDAETYCKMSSNLNNGLVYDYFTVPVNYEHPKQKYA